MQRTITTIVLVIAALTLVILGVAVLIIGLGGLSTAPDQSVFNALIGPVRSYLFRNALRNTLIVLAVVLPLTYLLGLAAVTLMTQNARSRGVMAWLLLLPLAMPVALAMPAWRQIFAASSALAGGVIPALSAVAVIQAWRILPFAALFLLLARPAGGRRAAAWLTLCFAAYVIVGDVGVTLLFTGGEPFNATHVLGSWIYQTAIAAAMPDQAAVLALGTVVVLALLALGFTHFAGELSTRLQDRFVRLQPEVMASTRRQRVSKRRQRNRQPRRRRGFVTSADHRPQAMGGVLLASPVIIVLLLPLSVPLVKTGDMALWPAALGELFTQQAYGYWLANTILLAGITALVTVTVAIPAGRRLANWQLPWSVRLARGLAILSMAILPVAFLPLARLHRQAPMIDSRLLLVLLYTSATLCIGIWLVMLVSQRRSSVPRTALTHWLALLSYLIVTNEMASALALSTGASSAQALNSGLTTRLVSDVSISRPAQGLAILLPLVLLMLFYWWLIRSRIAPLVEFDEEN